MSPRLAPLALTAGLMKPIAAWIKNAGGRRTLADMPDYLLKDIGLRRDQIETIADAVNGADAVAPAPAVARRSAKVVAFAAANDSKKTRPPEGPLAA